ncbi:hypothetical protein ABT187_46940, partial [Streptomyces sp. NPDC001817]|uniref:hypothetical protein n=1 Tax=Streptomyces sp. NPDC001817 TaxID=3154398 RepID=UPI00332DEDCC
DISKREGRPLLLSQERRTPSSGRTREVKNQAKGVLDFLAASMRRPLALESLRVALCAARRPRSAITGGGRSPPISTTNDCELLD